MNNISAFSLEGDSLNYGSAQSELDRLRAELKEKQNAIQEKNTIISSLRSRVEDFEHENEQLEIGEQILRQQTDRLKKEVEEKTQELEAVSHALKEIETANESLTKRYEARTGQLKKLVEELASSQKQLEEERQQKDKLKHENELLKIELDSPKLRKRSSRNIDEEDALAEEMLKMRHQINQLQQKNAHLMEESAKQLEQQKINLEQFTATKVSKEVEALNIQISQLKQQNDRLSTELKSKKTSLTSSSGEQQTDEEMIQELYDLRAQVKSLSHRQSRRSIDEEILKLRQELEITETSWKLEKQHKERYARENLQLDKKVNELSKQLNGFEQHCAMLQSKCKELEAQINESKFQPPPPPLPPKTAGQLAQQQAHIQDENKTEITAAVQFSMADEVGEFMDSSSLQSHLAKEKRSLNESSLWNQHDFCSKRSALHNESVRPKTVQAPIQNYCTNHRIQKSQFFNSDPIAEQKMRLERANELARRNMQTKPLHQTSYPLELDTFDTTNLTETEIKNGNVTRRALADSSNQRKPVKKAEAFII